MPPSLSTKNSESLYFPDGDIVLQSLPTRFGVATAFKVERAVLLQASPAFEKILDSSQDAEIPLVKLEDEADHLATFLTALYDPKSIEWELYGYDINKVERILLLANKYGVDDLRKHVISLLERDWPPKISGWDKNEADIEAKFEEEWDSVADMDMEYEALPAWPPLYLGPIPDPCAIIRLARKCKVPSILPAAFYHLSTLSIPSSRVISRGGRRIRQFERGPRPECADFNLLSSKDFDRVHNSINARYGTFVGCMRMAEEATIPVHNPSSEVGNKCKENFKCYRSALDGKTYSYEDDPLSIMKKPVDRSLLQKFGICEACGTAFHDFLKSKRAAYWSVLPVLFSLVRKPQLPS